MQNDGSNERSVGTIAAEALEKSQPTLTCAPVGAEASVIAGSTVNWVISSTIAALFRVGVTWALTHWSEFSETVLTLYNDKIPDDVDGQWKEWGNVQIESFLAFTYNTLKSLPV